MSALVAAFSGFYSSPERADILFLPFPASRDETFAGTSAVGHDRRKGGRALVTPDLRPSALVLAAGTSSRYRGTKQLADISGKTMVERVLDSLPSSELRETVVVLGHHSGAIARAIGHRAGVSLVVNEDYRSGIGGSIREGILGLSKRTPGVVLLLADQPFVSRSLIRRMLKAFEAERRPKIVAAESGELISPPIVFPKRFFPELLRLKGDRGAKSVIERHGGAVVRVRVRSRQVLSDVDTREDLEAARTLLEA